LRGLLRCSCGWKMSTHTAKSSGNGAEYHYYLCKQRKQRRQTCDCTQRAVRAEEVERLVWEFVSNLLRDPEEIRRGMQHLIERERTDRTGDPEHEAEVWAGKIAECDRRRSAYQDQQAAGMMALEELGARLKELGNIRKTAERELTVLTDRQQRVEDLEHDRDSLLEDMSAMVPEALDSLTGEEKNRIYQMLRIEVTPTTEGYAVSGGSLSFRNPMKMRSSPNSNSASWSTPWR
jgi:recombinase-like zinc beta ribbon protein